MFKKLFKSEASSRNDKVNILTSMGFNRSLAENALVASNGNVEQATNLLLSQGSLVSSSTSSSVSGLGEEEEEEQLQRAIRESQISASNHKARSAAAVRAGEAAMKRATNATKTFGSNGKVFNPNSKGHTTSSLLPNVANKNTSLSSLHPNVKVPTKMKDKSKEEQILRCASRLAPYPLGVDTLLKAFIMIRDHPNDEKYRKINKETSGYQNTLHEKPGALDLLKAMHFEQRHGTSHLILSKSMIDPALLYLAISALEQVRLTEEYTSAKAKIEFDREIKRFKDGYSVSQDEEIVKRASFISKCPSEPLNGAGALMQLNIGDEKIMRRFDGDDILQDVLNWIGGHGSVIPEKIFSRDWCLVDLNRYPIVPIDVEKNLSKTLQYVGCWPSGRLEIRPSSNDWKNGKNQKAIGDSRGLGASPMID
jgi:hypothetical protein